MTVEMISRTIQLILAPVVMVSACGLLLNGLVARYASVNERLRDMTRERLQLLRLMASNALDRERLSEIDVQIPDLLHRHKQLHDALLMIYCAILVFVGSMFVIALAVAAQSEWIANVALLLFLLGTAVLMFGALLTALEVRNSHRALHYEVQRVTGLNEDTFVVHGSDERR